MTRDNFINWLRTHLVKKQVDNIALIKEKLLLVDAEEMGYNYWSNVDPNKTSLAGEKLSYTVNATDSDTFTTGNLEDA